MKSTYKEVVNVWSDFIQRAIAFEEDGYDSKAVTFFTTEVIPIMVNYADDEVMEVELAVTERAYELLENIEGSEYLHYFDRVGWIENGNIRIYYQIANKLRSEDDIYRYNSIKANLPKMLQHIRAEMDSERLVNEMKSKNVAIIDPLIIKGKENTVIYKQSNKLTRSHMNNITLCQKKTISYLIWKYQSSKLFSENLFGEVSFNVSLQELKNCGCGANQTQIMKSLKNLGKETWIDFENTKGESITTSVFTTFKANNDSSFDVTFSQMFIALINKLAVYSEYTILNRETIAAARSYAATRLYELCCQFRNSEKYVVQIKDKELRMMLNCSEKYGNPKDFRSKVLLPAQKELQKLFEEKKSDLYFEFYAKERSSSKTSSKEYFSRDVITWVFVIRKNLFSKPFVENDDFQEKERVATTVMKQIVDIYSKDENTSRMLYNVIDNDLNVKEKINIAREMQLSIEELNKGGVEEIKNIIIRIRENRS